MAATWFANKDSWPGDLRPDEAYRLWVRPWGWLALLAGFAMACFFGREPADSQQRLMSMLGCSSGILLATLGMAMLSHRKSAWYAFCTYLEAGVFTGFLLLLQPGLLQALLSFCAIMVFGLQSAGVWWMAKAERHSPPATPDDGHILEVD